MLHYIRDHVVPYLNDGSTYDYAPLKQYPVLYHLLRVMGWTWLWECDGHDDAPNHVTDADMEASGVTSWNVVGTGLLAKDGTQKHQGTQSLRVTSQASGDGVESADMTPMLTTITYHIVIWAHNDTGAAWNVDIHNGSSYSTVGTIPDNGGVWTKHVFSYDSIAATNKFKIYDNNNSQGILYLDDVISFLSYYEYDIDNSGSDGDVQNSDEFHSTAYTFVVGDVGKTVIFYDPTNLGNTGAYEILSINGGNAVLDLKVGGAEVLTNTSVGNLEWRLYDRTVNGPFTANNTEADQAEGAGFGLQSPHSSDWRLFLRGRTVYGNASRMLIPWSAPTDTEFSVNDGQFFPTGPSVFRGRIEPYKWDVSQVGQFPGSGYANAGGDGSRLYAMIAGDGSFVTWFIRPKVETAICYTTMTLVGMISDNIEYTEQQRFCQLAKAYVSYGDEVRLMDDTYAFGFNGVAGTITDKFTDATLGVYATVTYRPNDDVNSRANIYSGNEWICPLTLIRDWKNTDGEYGELEMDQDDAFYWTRQNKLDFSTFDSDEYLHIKGGVVWKWPNISIV